MSEKAESTEVSYYRARYYDPSAGRFVQDPVGFNAGIHFANT
jgi:RHS repeat-associated protein